MVKLVTTGQTDTGVQIHGYNYNRIEDTATVRIEAIYFFS